MYGCDQLTAAVDHAVDRIDIIAAANLIHRYDLR